MQAADPVIAKVPPSDPSAERALIGACLLGGSASELESAPLGDDFYEPDLRAIWEAIVSLEARERPVDTVSVNTELVRSGRPDALAQLEELSDSSLGLANMDYYASTIMACAAKRRLIFAGLKIQALGYVEGEGVASLSDRAEQLLHQATEGKDTRSHSDMGQVISEAYKLANEGSDGGSVRPPGFPHLAHTTNGFRPGEMSILGARPSMGKTSLAMRLLLDLSQTGVPTGIVSLETTETQLGLNLLAMWSRVNSLDLRNGSLTQEEQRRVSQAAEDLHRLPIKFHDRPLHGLNDLRRVVRKMVQRDGVKLVAVDYLQLVVTGDRGRSRYEDVSEISRALKGMATAFGIHVMALSQLSRRVDDRPGNEPNLSDLRDSGQIEQDADLVMLLYRPGYYERDNADLQGKAVLKVAKNRNGPVGDVPLRWTPECVRFDEA